MSERDHKPVMHIVIKQILALVHQNFWDHPLGWRRWGMLRISSNKKSNTIRKHVLSTGKQFHLHLHEGISHSETTIFCNENADFQRVHCKTRSETSRKPLFFWGNRCMCIFIKVETARKPPFFTMKNADSRFGEYITLSYREGKPVACYASAVLWGTTTGPQCSSVL